MAEKKQQQPSHVRTPREERLRMKIDFSAVIKDLEGDVVKDGEKDATLGRVACTALLATRPNVASFSPSLTTSPSRSLITAEKSIFIRSLSSRGVLTCDGC